MEDKMIEYKGNQFYAIIHTIEIRVPKGDSKLADELDGQEYIKSACYRKDNVWAVINPNNYPNKGMGYICCLSDFKKVFNAILETHGIKQYVIHRVDVAINTKWKYEECYKLNCYLNNLDAVRASINNDYYTNDFKFEKRTVKNKKGGYEFEIYNKEIESNGRNEAKTRLEFRFTGYIDLTFENAIERAVEILNILPKYIDRTNKQRIAELSKRYKLEIEKGYVINFTEFVVRYNEFIYNTKILNGIYNSCMGGTSSGWLHKYKGAGRMIELYSKKDIKEYVKVLKNAILQYYDN